MCNSIPNQPLTSVWWVVKPLSPSRPSAVSTNEADFRASIEVLLVTFPGEQGLSGRRPCGSSPLRRFNLSLAL